MRLAYVCADPGVPVFGSKGSSIHVQEVVRSFVKRGWDVDLIATRLGGAAPPDLHRLRMHPLPAPVSNDPASREREALAANEVLRAALRRQGPFDLVYERYSLWSFAGMEEAQAHGAPGLLEVNAPLIEEQAEHRRLIDRAAAERVAQRTFGAASSLLAVSSEIGRYLEREAGPRSRVWVVPNGIEATRFPPGLPPTLPASPGAFTVGFLGTLKPWHGLEVLAEAFIRLHREGPESRLLVVGDGPERETLTARLSEAGLLEACHFTGPVGADAVPGLLASMDVAVAPYPARASFYFSPLKVYEYMAAGRPVVASRIGQLATVLENEVTALLCAPGDIPALTAALQRLHRDPTLRKRIGEAARAQALRDHTWDGIVARILEIAGLSAAQPAEARA